MIRVRFLRGTGGARGWLSVIACTLANLPSGADVSRATLTRVDSIRPDQPEGGRPQTTRSDLHSNNTPAAMGAIGGLRS